MPGKNTSVNEFLSRLRLYFQESSFARKYSDEPPPLRGELFNTEQLEQHGKYLASVHKVKTGQAKERLLKRLAGNEKILIEVRNLLTKAIKEDYLITPAGEWLLDNFYLIEENIHTGKKHLPKGYSESLPCLVNTESAGLPRVYDIALEIISHSDGRIDLESLDSFITAYQSVTNLQIGELWAIPIMLRLALIENLRRVSARVAIDRVNRNLADYWAKQMVETAEKDPKSLILVIADMARSGPPMESSFVAELIRQLMWKGPSLALPLTWMEQRLSESGFTSNELVNLENQQQAADQVSISNSIGSLRFLSSIKWREFVEKMSIVERTLRQDISGIYPKMDFATRDRYRHIVEKIAKSSSFSENEVASIAIKHARESNGMNEADNRMAHVGYYLVGDGVTQTEKSARTKLSFRERFQKTARHFPLTFYAGTITLLSLIISGYLFAYGYYDGINKWLLALTGVISFLAATHLATALVNWVATLLFKPELLPRMDFSEGIPSEFATIVVVPTMLINAEEVNSLIETLEVRFLANRDNNLFFGLLTDFRDAATETLPEDEPLLELAKQKIKELNQKYHEYDNKFFLFNRSRKWNARDKIWMGYERKRGKLTELNALLRGRAKDYFSTIVGDVTILPKVKYIITLDTDTQLPHDAGWKLAGTMAHPLNSPFYDDKKQRITKGYGILQPRVSVSLSRSDNSFYSLMQGNEPGIDPYTRLTSDVYQDLFDEGSFIGKGIYDIDAFEQALNGRFPENRILSHDLLEGCYTRAGLLSDVQLYEEYPTHYSDDVNRRHRWIRGDWQIGFWSLPITPDVNRRLRKNLLSGLSRWKILDNLRRSLVPVALTLLLLLGWTVLHNTWFWTLSVLLIIMLPSVIASAWNILWKSNEFTLWQHIASSITSMKDNFFRNAFLFVCLPYEAYYSLDAILRTSWRMMVSHKKLLEWNPSGSSEHSSDRTLSAAYQSMWFSPFIALVMFIYLTKYDPVSLITAMPVLILWAFAPFAAWWVSKPFVKHEAKLTPDQIVFLRTISRKTWAFFENFVGPEDNWLPPDNYQEHPNGTIAHRTSPTNIGLALLANLSAYDFGYITAGTLIMRTANTIKTLGTMERYQGHLYNWYDTVSLKAMHPKYISTVDSGNMAGHLLTLRQGLIAIPYEKIEISRLFKGLKDTMCILEKEIHGNILLQQLQTDIEIALNTLILTPVIAKQYVEISLKYATGIADSLKAEKRGDVDWWAEALVRQCNNINEELSFLFPWLLLVPVPVKFQKLFNTLDSGTLDELVRLEILVLPEIKTLHAQGNTIAENDWLDALSQSIRQASQNANERIAAISHIEQQCAEFANLDYDFLYDKSKHLLAIGYNVEEYRKDSGYYDLLASESNLCTFVAIAQGKLPQESWFALGRLLTYSGGTPLLLSWSGSMFEYLMPLLIMPEYEHTLLHQTHKTAVEKQIKYGIEHNVPWGISESGYNAVDANLNYQYRAFGVPGLGFKRGLADDLVIAPYASALALMVAPEEACRNMEHLSAEGFEGKFGFYEAIDYTPSRLLRGQSRAVIRSFMAHHQGMSLLSLAYALLDQPMQKRFESDLQFRSAMLLLQERMPKNTTFYTYSADTATTVSSVSGNKEMRVINSPHTPIPEIQLLSNGKYHVMVTNAGGGYSKWKDMAVTRWREDTTCDNWGTFCYIRDLEDMTFWSNVFQPTLKEAKYYEAAFTEGRAEFRRQDGNIETHTEIVVSPEDDIEMRRIHITNRSRRKRTIDITSYAEVVLTSPIADSLHPAFNKLFIQTEIVRQRCAILCTRRPRSAEEQATWMFHMVTVHGVTNESISYETDRMKFIGRGNSIASPAVMNKPGPLSNTQGSVLDPIVSIRHELTLQPEETIIIDIITGISETRDACIGLVEKYQDKHHKDRVFELAWTHSQVVLRQINATEADAQLYGQLASSIIFNNPLLRADPSVIMKNRRSQSGLWGYSISGDLPIILLQIENQVNIELAKQLVQAHAYWRLKGLAVDLVIWNEDYGGYRQVLQNQILGLISADHGAELTDHPGGIFVRAADQISDEDNILFQTVARITISDKRGTLEDHINRKSRAKNIIPSFTPLESYTPSPISVPKLKNLEFFNGLGGFSGDGREYVIVTSNEKRTPLPWANVLSNPYFGTVISESGQSYTWVENAHELRLTPWDNDPVCDQSGEVFYLRDEETGYYWSPAPLPACGTSAYITRHGFGYSVFEHNEDGIESEMWVYVDIEAAIKFFVIKLKNHSGRQRKLSATGYIDWVLGDLKPKTGMHIVTEIDPGNGAFLAKNVYNPEFSDRVAFFDTDDSGRTYTGDRTEFIGRNGTLKNPDAMSRARLSGKTGAALDPCAAIQTTFVLSEDQERNVIFRLGVGKNIDINKMVLQFRGLPTAQSALEKVRKYWQDSIDIIQVETPDQSVNILTNGWLMYQTVSCRLWARSGYYQSGGAFGFRDQLQDALAVLHTQPILARKQILLCASRQFKEGDVQHWWHPPGGRGVRTLCSDDLLWLPFVTCNYVLKTGDSQILDENSYFLEGRLLNPGERSYYDLPAQSGQHASLYEHCVRAIEHALKFGEHGLPFIGSGDWNDGMDLVGKDGKGESVWLGFFLYSVLMQFANIASARSDNDFAEKCITEAAQLQINIEKNGWDGNWYRRAYFDDGTPLGSAENPECQIDSIAQSWAILSGAGAPNHVRIAIDAADKRLVNTKSRLIQLLDPPFDKSTLNPGYIKGYVPGIRENGGQYTHAAIWMIMAQAKLGNTQRAWELLRMINPVNHANSEADVSVYKAEPYVVAADVYSMSQNNGHAGWTWYTGSAGWMYKLIVEWLLGMRLEGNKLRFTPCIPEDWESYKIIYRFRDTTYHIILVQGKMKTGEMSIEIDGAKQDGKEINLIDDKSDHKVVINF